MEGLNSNLRIQVMKPQELPYHRLINADVTTEDYEPEMD